MYHAGKVATVTEQRSDGLPLVRRRVDGDRVREFVHPADGSPAVERPVGARGDGAGTRVPRTGQLIPRRVRLTDGRAPIVVPLLRASCDGSGACCGLYHHVPATLEDRDKVLAAFGDGWDREIPLEDVFHGAFDGRDDPLNIVAIDGSCAFRHDDGRCRIHAAGGGQAKPQSCLSYPAHLVACGSEWHASLRTECACVARSAVEGEPLNADPEVWVRLRSTLPRVWAVPREVAVDERKIPRDDYVAWLRGLVAGLKTTFDPLAALEEGRRALWARVGVDVEPLGPPPKPTLAALAERLTAEAADAARAFDAKSPYRRSIAWGAALAATLAQSERPVVHSWSRGRAADWARRAASTVSLVLHGHALLERPALGAALDELVHLVHLAHAAEAVLPAADADPRLESLTTWLFLHRNVLT